MATEKELEEAWVQGWVQAYHDLWDIFAIANAEEAPDAEQRPAAHHARIAHVGEAVAAQCAAKEGATLSADS